MDMEITPSRHHPLFLVMFFILAGWAFLFSLDCHASDISLILRNGAIIEMTAPNPPLPATGREFSEVDRFVKLISLNISGLTYSYQNKTYKLDFPQIQRYVDYIELLDPDLSPYKEGRMVIRKTDGQTLTVNDGTFLQYIGYEDAVANFNIVEFDSFNKFWRDKYLDIRDVRVIRFRKELPPISADTARKYNFASKSGQMVASLSRKKSGNKVHLNIEFDFDSYRIRPGSYSVLKELGKALSNKKLVHKKITISGHTDSDGPTAYNQTLSIRRAKSVRDYLVKNCGIAASRLSTAGYGETRPLVPNTTRANKQINRRVEIRAR